MTSLFLFILVFLQFSLSLGGEQATISVGEFRPMLVFAHFMIGIMSNRNSASDYDADMKLAKAIGIDAFALNIATDSYTDQQLTYAYNSAAANGMKVFISFDCSFFHPGDEGTIGAKIHQYASHPAQLKVPDSNSRNRDLVFASTFVGDPLNVASIRNAAKVPIYFAPNFHPGWESFAPLDGAFNWAAWPSNGANKAPTNGQKIVTVDSGDKSYLSALKAPSKREVSGGDDGVDDGSDGGDGYEDEYGEDDGTGGDSWYEEYGGASADAFGVLDASLDWNPDYQAYEDDSPSVQAAPRPSPRNKGYIAPVSPWFFTHYGAEVSYSKNWVFPSDLLFYLRWLEILALKPPFVEIITWNDYGESHYIGPLASKHTDDGASKWVNDMPHVGWANLSKPFIAAYKSSSPSVSPFITADQIIYWYRTIPKSLDCDATDTTITPGGNNASGNFFRGRPNGYETLTDNIFVVTLLTSPGIVTVNSGGTLYTYDAPQGSSAFAVPFQVGSQRFALIRNGAEVMGATSLKVIQDTCPCGLYNYNPYVGVVPDKGVRDVLTTGSEAYGKFGDGLKVTTCEPMPSLPVTPPKTMEITRTVRASAAATSPPV
ncbi:hypothetical protein PM082_021849 [Marasmius tenuissimus]|nr:hypothetical protein PM082_021849 [Marasmius tenuissimus]